MGREFLSIAYVHYGAQSGVTQAVSQALAGRGHEVRLVDATGELEPRDPATRRLRPTPRVALHLALALAQFRGRALQHRWNTTFAFDTHSRRAGVALRALTPAPDLVLQNGALFSPGLPAPYLYTLLLDNTGALASRAPAWPEAGLGPPADLGARWRAREAAVYRGARLLAVFSERVAGSLVRDYAIARERIAVVGAGANVFPAEAPRQDDGKTVLFVGKDFARKGGRVLFAAFERLRRRVPKARLLIAGPPAALPLPLPEGAFQLGAVDFLELPALLSQTTVLALPTLREPFGIAYLDAMACGVPVVGTRIEAVPEIVRDGEDGLLVPPGDVAALATALERLLSAPSLARAMGERGRARVGSRFRWEHVAARLERALGAAAPAARRLSNAAAGHGSWGARLPPEVVNGPTPADLG